MESKISLVVLDAINENLRRLARDMTLTLLQKTCELVCGGFAGTLTREEVIAACEKATKEAYEEFREGGILIYGKEVQEVPPCNGAERSRL
jgi:hypothetical protein